LGVPDEGYSRNASWGLNLISTFYHYHFANTSFGALLFPEGISRPVGSASAPLALAEFGYSIDFNALKTLNYFERT